MLMMLIMVALTTPAWAGTEVLINGQFENGFFGFWGGNMPNGWGATWRDVFEDDARWESHLVADGHGQVVRLTNITTDFEIGIVQQVSGLTPGAAFTFSAEAYQYDPGTNVWIGVDPQGNTDLLGRTTHFDNIAHQWNAKSVTGTVGSSGTVTVFLWAWHQWGNRADVYLDNASLIVEDGTTTGRIDGTVRDTQGQPLSGATVRTDSGSYSTTTATDGTYALEHVPTGTYQLIASKDGYGDETAANVTVNENQSTTIDFAMANASGTGQLIGAVQDLLGNALAGATITVEPGNITTSTEPDGTYSIANLSVGTYTVTAELAGFIPGPTSGVVISTDAITTLDFTLADATGEEKLLNGSFEEGTFGFWGGVMPNSWGATWRDQYASGSEWHTLELDGDHGHVVSLHAMPTDYEMGLIQQVTDLMPGAGFKLSAEAYTLDTGTHVWLAVDPNGGTQLPAKTTHFDNIPNQWHYKEVSGAVGADGKVTVFVWAFHEWGPTVDTYLDNISLIVGGSSGPQTGTMAGVVRDTASQPVAGVTVATDRGGNSTLTADDGSYTLDNVVPGTYTVTAAKGGYTAETQEGVGVSAGTTTLVDFTLTAIPGNGTLAGTVTDPQGHGIDGVQVATGDGSYSTLTDADGQYLFAQIAPGTYTLTFTTAGYLTTTEPGIEVIGGQTTTLDVTMATGQRQEVLSNGDFEDGDFEFWGGDMPNAWGAVWRGAFEGGDWRVLNVGDGHYRVAHLKAIPTEFEAGIIQQVSGLTSGEQFVFSAEAYQFNTGTNVWIGVDANGGTVLPERQTHFDNIAEQWNYKEVTGTVGDSGTVTVFIWAFHQWGPSADVYIDNASLQVGTPNDPEDAVIIGTVIDDTGNPVPGAQIETDTGGYTATSHDDGTYTLPSLKAGFYTLTASKNGYADDVVTDVTAYAGYTTTVDFTLSGIHGTLTGSVTDSQGQPVVDATVTTDTGGHTVMTNQQGTFVIADVLPGVYDVTAGKVGYVAQTQYDVKVAGGGTVVVNFTLNGQSGTGHIAGQVIDDDGDPVAEAVVYTTPGSYQTRTGGDGSYLLNNVAAGTYTLLASKDGYLTASQPNVGVQADSTTTVEITLIPEVGVEVLANGDFEDGFFGFWAGQCPNLWGAVWREPYTAASWDFHYGGEHGHVVNMRKLTNSFEAGIIQQVTGLQPGDSFKFSAEAFQFSEGTRAWLGADPNGGTTLPQRSIHFANRAGQWHSEYVEGVVGPSGTVTVFLWAWYEYGDPADVYFDNASLIVGTWSGPTPGTLAGYVRDNNGNPLPSAVVQTGDGNYSDTTDNNGFFQILDVEPGMYELTASANGYVGQTAEGVRVNGYDTQEVTFELEPLSVGGAFVRIEGDQFVWGGQVVKIKGANYYPRKHMWAKMWSDFAWSDMVEEAAMIRDLGMNCVRLLVPYDKGGWSDNPSAEKLQQLEDVVNLFGENGIRSCVTLFDWETSFPEPNTGREAEHFQYLSAIVYKLKDNPYVLCWDVKNEPDHPANLAEWMDNWDASSRKTRIVTWLHRMCDKVRSIDQNHPVSAGLRWWENVDDVLGFVDFVMFHSYWPNMGDEQIPDVKGYMGANQLPILVEEYGWPSHPTPCDRGSYTAWDYTEQDQLDRFIGHMEAFDQHDIVGGIAWMAFDQKNYSNKSSDSFENYFGFWRYNLTLKPSGEYYRDNWPVMQFFNLPPKPIDTLTAELFSDHVALSWQTPADPDFARTMLRVSTSNYPEKPTDGELLCDLPGQAYSSESFIHDGLQPGVMYYYAAFAVDDAGQFASGAKARGTLWVPPDLDRDGDVDAIDYQSFLSCRTGPYVSPPPPGCEMADLDADGDIDQSDFSIIQRCMSGEGIPAYPNCADW